MHSRIFEITSEPINSEDYLTSSMLDPEQYSGFADYIDDEVDAENSIEWFATCMSGIFDCDGRRVKLRDISGFIDLWKADVRDKAGKFDPNGDRMSSYYLRKALNKTHEGIEFRFFDQDRGLMSARQLIENVLLYHKPGDKFYIGGILDYHF